jgi:hypothetical protein
MASPIDYVVKQRNDALDALAMVAAERDEFAKKVEELTAKLEAY